MIDSLIDSSDFQDTARRFSAFASRAQRQLVAAASSGGGQASGPTEEELAAQLHAHLASLPAADAEHASYSLAGQAQDREECGSRGDGLLTEAKVSEGVAALAERLGELARRAAADPVLLHELNEACSDGVALTTKQGGREICTECEGRASSSSSSSDCAVDFLGLGDCNLDGGALLAELGDLPPLTELPAVLEALRELPAVWARLSPFPPADLAESDAWEAVLSRGESMATQRGWLEVTAAAALPAGAKYAGSGEPRATALLLLTLLCADAQAGLLLRRRLGLVAALRAPMGLAARHADVEGAEPSLPASSSADNGSPPGARFLNIFHGWHDGDRGDNGVSSPSGQYGAADGAPPAAFADLSSPPCCLDEVCRSRLLARLLQWGVPSEWALDHRSLARSEYFPLHRPPAPAANRPPPLSSAVTTAYPPRSPLLAPVAAAAALLEGGSLDAATAALRAAFAAAGVHANTTGTDSLCANSAESLPQRRAVGQPIRLSPPSEPVPSIAVAANRLPPHWVTGAVLLLRYAARAGSLSTEAAAREGDGLPSGAHLASLSLVSLPPPAHRLSYAGESLTVACARLLAFLADLSSIVWDSSGSGSSEDTPLDLFAAMAWTLGGDTAARRSLGDLFACPAAQLVWPAAFATRLAPRSLGPPPLCAPAPVIALVDRILRAELPQVESALHSAGVAPALLTSRWLSQSWLNAFALPLLAGPSWSAYLCVAAWRFLEPELARRAPCGDLLPFLLLGEALEGFEPAAEVGFMTEIARRYREDDA
ncbi:hypothetical protein EMIHUDRAFT_456508 [Emiliania huxleyi CCMP1516]|uniref:BROMI C-terminal Rab TBC-like domain-containing protein n=2 Tax=Emiliania huxleyi TaxID=2903 RepID=A0A0D3K4F2_EMIH1|nr:hypothetical protein EMIHUDRAFT_456508 [Emiliania huxleyi CCMP1516]EOD30637.1 hypothetical protein EMIHUDRAFT_456508 [Emiliania huxleyi CCMP1516]|eukprot:XP_005783066.1 hypothetical protein EMIHUDRAFT_456508 [Emiliania huxleyi CCMP1516]